MDEGNRDLSMPTDAMMSGDGPGLPVEGGSDKTPLPSSQLSNSTSRHQHRDLPPVGRLLLTLCALLLLAGFGLSAWLTPDPQGHGTHRQLGLAPCSFLMFTGKPCPSCGATTAFAHYVRGQWSSAVRSNAAAFVLALVCSGLVLWCIGSAARGRLIGIQKIDGPILILVITMSSLFALQWGINLLTYD